MPEERRSARITRRSRFAAWAAGAASLLWLAVAGAAAKLPPDSVSLEVPVYELEDLSVIEERWDYSMGWGGIPVGSVSVSGGNSNEDGVESQTVSVTGSTNGFVDLFWRYRLSANGEIRVSPFAPGHFHIDENEKKKEKITRIDFDQDRRVHLLRHREGDTPNEYEFDAANTFDVLSTTWMFLNLDYEIGRVYEADTVTGTARYHVKITAEAEETIEVCDEPVEAIRLLGRTSEITDPEKANKHRETHIWISKDRPRRLLQAQSKTTWGSITLALTEIADLRGDVPEAGGEQASQAPVSLCAAEAHEQSGPQRRFGPRRFH